MFNKILIFWGLTITLIIVFSVMVGISQNVPFLWFSVSAWMLVIINTFIGVLIWYWFKSFLDKNNDNDNYDF